MGHAIQLNFDKSTSTKIKKLWTALKYHNICDFLANNSVEPHVTLFVFDKDITASEGQMVNVVNEFFKNEGAIEVDIMNIGVQYSDANVVSLNVLVTEQLLSLHHRLYDVLVEEGFDEHIIMKCKPGKWIPYITMTMNIKETDMVDAIKLIKRKFKPMTAKTDSATFLKFYPVEYKTKVEMS